MKSQIFLLLALLAIALTQCAAVSLKTEEEAFPPVVFTYNATRCEGCKFRCRAKFDRVHLTERKACRSNCDKKEYCVHYSPVEIKPDPVNIYTVNPVLARAAIQAVNDQVINMTQLAAANNNLTQALINVITPAPKEYVGAENKPADAGEFFKKLQSYIGWRQYMADKKDNFTNPEWKDQDVLPQIPVVCVECVRKIMGPGETILAHVVDRPRNRTRPVKPVKPVEPVKNVTETPVKPPADITIPIDNTKPAEGTGNTPIVDAPELSTF